MTERRYLPTIADLIDRLSITLMKSIFIDRESYRSEMQDILHDLRLFTGSSAMLFNADAIYATLVLMLANRYIWENEHEIREIAKDMDNDALAELPERPLNIRAMANMLRATHSVNGVRTRAKNEISKIFGERIDTKIDCLASDLPEVFGNWRVFEDE